MRLPARRPVHPSRSGPPSPFVFVPQIFCKCACACFCCAGCVCLLLCDDSEKVNRLTKLGEAPNCGVEPHQLRLEEYLEGKKKRILKVEEEYSKGKKEEYSEGTRRVF